MKKILSPHMRNWTQNIILFLYKKNHSYGSEISRAIKRSQSIISKQLKILTKEGFVVNIQKDDVHKNSKIFTLTDNGKFLAKYFIYKNNFDEILQKKYGSVLK